MQPNTQLHDMEPNIAKFKLERTKSSSINQADKIIETPFMKN